jgi:hypothetical protein
VLLLQANGLLPLFAAMSLPRLDTLKAIISAGANVHQLDVRLCSVEVMLKPEFRPRKLGSSPQ